MKKKHPVARGVAFWFSIGFVATWIVLKALFFDGIMRFQLLLLLATPFIIVFYVRKNHDQPLHVSLLAIACFSLLMGTSLAACFPNIAQSVGQAAGIASNEVYIPEAIHTACAFAHDKYGDTFHFKTCKAYEHAIQGPETVLGADTEKIVTIEGNDAMFSVRVERKNGELVCSDNRQRDQILADAIEEAFDGTDSSSFLECKWFDAPLYFHDYYTPSSGALKSIVAQKHTDNNGEPIPNFYSIRDVLYEGTATATLYAVVANETKIHVNENKLRDAFGSGDYAECTIVRMAKGISPESIENARGNGGIIESDTFPMIGRWQPYLSEIRTFGRNILGKKALETKYRDVSEHIRILSTSTPVNPRDLEKMSGKAKVFVAGPWRVKVNMNRDLDNWVFLPKQEVDTIIADKRKPNILQLPCTVIGELDTSYGSYYVAEPSGSHNVDAEEDLGNTVLVCIETA